jgi:hypothetical protein
MKEVFALECAPECASAFSVTNFGLLFIGLNDAALRLFDSKVIQYPIVKAVITTVLVLKELLWLLQLLAD